MIDLAFEDLATKRLGQIQRFLRRPAEDIAHDMMRTTFPRVKEDYGSDTSDNQPHFRIQIPGMPDNFEVPDAGVSRGKMTFSQ